MKTVLKKTCRGRGQWQRKMESYQGRTTIKTGIYKHNGNKCKWDKSNRGK